MRVKEPIITSKRYFKIFLLIAKKINYNKVIAEELSIKPNTLIVLMQDLEKTGYLKTKQEKKFNRKIYEINYNKLAKELVIDLRKDLLKVLREENYIISRYVGIDEVKKERDKIWKNINLLNKNKALPSFIEMMLYLKIINDEYEEYDNDLIMIREMNNLRDLFIILINFIRYYKINIKLDNDKDIKELYNIINLLFEKYGEDKNALERINNFFTRYNTAIDKQISKITK